MSTLRDKVAIVTGASKGIGAAIAEHLAAAGAAVVVNYASSKEGADRVVAEIRRHGGKALAVQANVAKQADVERLFSETKKAFSRLDILVNNAGSPLTQARLEDCPTDLWRRAFDINVTSAFFVTRRKSLVTILCRCNGLPSGWQKTRPRSV